MDTMAIDPRDMRIAIIGAGISGLTAAHTLVARGYRDITIYEKEDRVGGKIHSTSVHGHVLELGGVWINQYPTIQALADRYQVTFFNDDAKLLVRDRQGRTSGMYSRAIRLFGLPRLFSAFLKFQNLKTQFPFLQEAGFEQLPSDSDLCLSVTDFATKHKLEPIVATYLPFWNGCGYGYYNEIPALYLMKMLMGGVFRPLQLLTDFLMYGNTGGGFGLQRAPDGFQQLLERMAEDFKDVRLSQTVASVRRRRSNGRIRIDVEANGVTDTFDRIIISSGPRRTLAFLDTTAEEEDIFARTDHYRFCIHIIRAENLSIPGNTLTMLEGNNTDDRIGHMAACCNRKEASGLWTTGQLASRAMTDDEITEVLLNDLREFGGKEITIEARQDWDYFPHFKTEALRDGAYRRLEALQGRNGTYYIGGLHNFEVIEYTAMHAKTLIDQHFQRLPLPAGAVPP